MASHTLTILKYHYVVALTYIFKATLHNCNFPVGLLLTATKPADYPKRNPLFWVLGGLLWGVPIVCAIYKLPLRHLQICNIGQPSYQSLTPQLSRQSPLELGSSCLIVLVDGGSSVLSKDMQFCVIDHIMLSIANQDATEASIKSHVECVGVEDIAMLIPSP